MIVKWLLHPSPLNSALINYCTRGKSVEAPVAVFCFTWYTVKYVPLLFGDVVQNGKNTRKRFFATHTHTQSPHNILHRRPAAFYAGSSVVFWVFLSSRFFPDPVFFPEPVATACARGECGHRNLESRRSCSNRRPSFLPSTFVVLTRPIKAYSSRPCIRSFKTQHRGILRETRAQAQLFLFRVAAAASASAAGAGA